MAKEKSFPIWKYLRILILLLILLVVIVNSWRDKNQNWNRPIFVALYPVNADQSAVSQHYIQQLKEQDFLAIADYLQQQSLQYRGQPAKFYFKLGAPVAEAPPKVPENGSVLSVMLWSLKFRYYAWKNKQNLNVGEGLTLFLNYYDPQTHKVLKHSTALENGRIGSIHLFSSAKQHDQNQIVIAHEMLHAFGATDKYNLSTGQPLYPQGLGNPNQVPLYPQHTAELMAGQIALSANENKMAENLQQVVVNRLTAQEIGWLKKPE